MKWSYGMCGGQGPIVRDMVVYDASTIAKGQAVSVVLGANGAGIVDINADLTEFAGVAMQEQTDAATAFSSGTLKFAKICVSPDAVYRAAYDQTTANDISVASATSTAVTVGTSDDNAEGGFIYVNSGTGQGQLAYIGAATTTVYTIDTTTAYATTLDSTSDIIHIRKPLCADKDLDSTFVLLDTEEAEDGHLLVLENFIQADNIPLGPMRPRQHHMLQNLHNHGVKFSSDVWFQDCVFRGSVTL